MDKFQLIHIALDECVSILVAVGVSFHAEPWELGVDTDIVVCINKLDNLLEFLLEILGPYFFDPRFIFHVEWIFLSET